MECRGRVKWSDLKVVLVSFRDEAVMYAANMCYNVSKSPISVDCNSCFVFGCQLEGNISVPVHCKDI